MANEEHLTKLREGVESWNKWVEENFGILPDLSNANLTQSDFSNANLMGVNFSGTDLSGGNFTGANLRFADLSRTNLRNASLRYSDLTEVSCIEANLEFADLIYANLRSANLSGAKFNHTLLLYSQLLFSNLTSTILTGACIQDWNINNETNLDDVICEYVYLKQEFSVQEQMFILTDRRPSDSNVIFAPGEFAKLFQKALETVDLIFMDGIDWKAFFQSFQELRSRYGDDHLSIQAIEKKSGGAFVIRLEVPPEADKAAIESLAKDLYERDRQILEAQYRERLNAKDDQIEIYKKQSSSMEEIAKLLATRPIKFEEPKVTLHPNQLKILQAVHDGLEHSSRMPEAIDLPIDTVKYYIEILQNESYLECAKYSDGLSGHSNYKCQLTSKGRVALENPDLLQRQNNNVLTHQTTINAPNSQFGFVNSGNGTVSDFTQNIGQNLNDITKLIDSLREAAQSFPAEQREEALGHLDDLQEDLSKPERQEPSRIKRRLKALIAIAIITAEAVDFTNNLTDLAEKLGVPIELKQSQTLQQLPSSDGR